MQKQEVSSKYHNSYLKEVLKCNTKGMILRKLCSNVADGEVEQAVKWVSRLCYAQA